MPSVIKSPPPGSTLLGSVQLFEWNLNTVDVENSWLYVGAMPGGSDYAAIRTGLESSVEVVGLPVDGRDVHARLYFRVSGRWYYLEEQYSAAQVEPREDSKVLVAQLQTLVGVDADGIVGPITKRALNSNWIGRVEKFDKSFATKFVNNEDLVEWTQSRLNSLANAGLVLDGGYGPVTEAAAKTYLNKGGIVAVESFLALTAAK